MEKIEYLKASPFLLLTIYDYGDKIKDNEMDGASNTCGEEDKGIQNFGGDI
jgi:hypothetical protein